jgi:hypothetical protein
MTKSYYASSVEQEKMLYLDLHFQCGLEVKKFFASETYFSCAGKVMSLVFLFKKGLFIYFF